MSVFDYVNLIFPPLYFCEFPRLSVDCFNEVYGALLLAPLDILPVLVVYDLQGAQQLRAVLVIVENNLQTIS